MQSSRSYIDFLPVVYAMYLISKGCSDGKEALAFRVCIKHSSRRGCLHRADIAIPTPCNTGRSKQSLSEEVHTLIGVQELNKSSKRKYTDKYRPKFAIVDLEKLFFSMAS